MSIVVRPMGPHAVLLELPDGTPDSATSALLAGVMERHHAGLLGPVAEIVPAARTVLLDGLADPAATAALLRDLPLDALPPDAGPLVTVPTVYDGEDLAAVAEYWGMSPAEAVELHTTTEFRVAFCGFAPGFAYLTGLPAERAVPRLASPRTRVPAGSVALAGPYTGVYPTASPGGWQLVGRTALSLWDPGRNPPAVLTPGTRVRFAAVAG
jgi:allophanate hydrolase subunit 1